MRPSRVLVGEMSVDVTFIATELWVLCLVWLGGLGYRFWWRQCRVSRRLSASLQPPATDHLRRLVSMSLVRILAKAWIPLVRFVVDLFYNKLYSRSTTSRTAFYYEKKQRLHSLLRVCLPNTAAAAYSCLRNMDLSSLQLLRAGQTQTEISKDCNFVTFRLECELAPFYTMCWSLMLITLVSMEEKQVQVSAGKWN